MSRRRNRKRADDVRLLSADNSPEDGTNAKDFHAKPWNAPKQASRKAQQLCRQVRESLTTAFASCADTSVQAATVFAVEPAPHTGRLLVIVVIPPDCTRDEVATALERASGHLRREVASAISRRYTPELTFEVLNG